MKRKLLLSSLILSLGLSAMTSNAKPLPPPLPEYKDNSNNYALTMLRSFNKDAGDKNLIFSPLNIQFMMGMLGTAADPQTTEQIVNAWYPKTTTTIEDINRQVGLHLRFTNASTSSKASAKIGNGLFVSNKYQLNPVFKEAIAGYNAEISSVDFTKPETVKLVNDWVSKHTDQMIPKIIDKFSDPELTVMALINAISFKGEWPKQFFDVALTKNREFTGINGKKSVPTMHKQGIKKHYYEDDNLQAIYLPYEGYQYGLLVVLPKATQSNSLDQLVEKFDFDYFDKVTKGLFNQSGDVAYNGTLYLPRFSSAYSNDKLVDQSKELLGVDLTQNATFDKVVTNTKQKIQLSAMIHKAVIEVNEEGTKAAAVTYAEFGVTSIPMPPKELIEFTMDVNHPFIYGIMDNQHQLLFLGTMKSFTD